MRSLALFLLLLQPACGAGWRRPPQLPAAGFDERQQVRVWYDGSSRQLHGVVFMHDSLSGIPFFRPLDCDSCRVAVPRAEIDSVQVGDPMGGLWRSVALGAAVFFGWYLMYCYEGCSSD
jgi:hypothetical protein